MFSFDDELLAKKQTPTTRYQMKWQSSDKVWLILFSIPLTRMHHRNRLIQSKNEPENLNEIKETT